ncbi:MAG: hypothetical protein LC624_06280 [Halobacteriales archaeon]|nr:hypothetical protein [Halobacteriales archaeon]
MATGGLSIQREELASFLQDVPQGGHAVLRSEGIGLEEALDACLAAAEDQDEELRVLGVRRERVAPAARRVEPRIPDGDLDGFVRGLVAPAGGGVLLVIDAEGSARGSSVSRHVAFESGLRAHAGGMPRVVCIYSREAVALFGPRFPEVRGMHDFGHLLERGAA